MMLQKIILKCKCLKDGDVVGLAGLDIYKCLMEHVNVPGPPIKTEMMPFSISPLRGKDVLLNDGISRIKEGMNYSFGITALDKESVEVIKSFANALLQEELQLGNAQFRCQEFRSLFNKPKSYLRLMTETEVHNRIWFNLFTPLCVKVRDGVSRYPKPGILMDKLLQKWNAFSGYPFPDPDFKKVRLYRYRLTPEVHFGEGLSGSKGDWEFTFANGVKEDLKWMVNTLVRFASLAGLGDYTEKGMGQVIVKGSVEQCA